MFCCGPLPVLRRGGRHNPGSGIGRFFSFDLLRAVFYFSLQLQYITLHSRKINVSWKNNFEKYFRKTCRTRSWGVVRNFSGSRGVWRGKSFCFFPSVSCPAGEGGERRLLVSFLSRDISIALIPSFICFFFFFFLCSENSELRMIFFSLYPWERTCGLRNSGLHAIRMRLCPERCVRRGNLRTVH